MEEKTTLFHLLQTQLQQNGAYKCDRQNKTPTF